jgi:hypothetical protein
MSTRADSYSTAGEVAAFTRYLLVGPNEVRYTSFSSTTQPTLTQVEKFIDRASASLNSALRLVGLTTPVTNSTAKLVCDDWVTDRVVELVELTNRGAGFNDSEGNRAAGFRNLHKAAAQFASENRLGFLRLGAGVSNRPADGLQFTGLDAQPERADPDDGTLAQPLFTRRQFDEPGATRYTVTDQEDAE